MADFALAVHALWVVWMVSGVFLAVLGYWKNRLWELTVFRIGHLIGIIVTATVPIWNDGKCPITQWESSAGGHDVKPFLTRTLEALVYWDTSPTLLTLLTAGSALLTAAIFIGHPPKRLKQVQRTSQKVGPRPSAR